MNGWNGQPSPDSVSGSDWQGTARYPRPDHDASYHPGARGQLASPPISRGSSSTMNGGGGGGGGYLPRNDLPGNPSPPASIARSSGAPSMYNQGADGGRGKRDEYYENMLADHYILLKRFLAASLRDDKGNPRPNRARDKLLRLSAVQFQELSTDVYDELQRRQDSSRKGPDGQDGASAFLLPKDIFHPKRNQARQKLSTLPPPRFKDLATDVFYEIERRFPRFLGGDINRVESPASSTRGPPSRNGNVTPVNGRGPQRLRRPSDASSIAGYSIRSESRSRNGPMNGGSMIGPPGSPGLPPHDYNRPQPKTFQSNTMVPNKSTMVEDDETGDEDDAFALEGATGMRPGKDNSRNEPDSRLIEEYQSQISGLQSKLESMENSLRFKDDELSAARSQAMNTERNEFAELRIQLESQLADAQTLNANIQFELEKLKAQNAAQERDLQDHANAERELRGRVEELSVRDEQGDRQLRRENNELKELLKQQEIDAEGVRREAQDFLREMRMLSEQTASAFSREEELSNHIVRLEEEVKDWRNRYARTKTQLRSLRASSMGLTLQPNASQYAQNSELVGDDGLVADVHVTKFQISIDELLRVARENDPSRVIEYMKAVVVGVRRITQDIDEATPTTQEVAQAQAKLKSRVSATANNLITASKNFAAAQGLSPVSLLDAAASHLTTAVVDLVRTVKIRPTPAGDLQDDDDGTLMPVDTTGFFKHRETKPESKPDLKLAPQPFLGLRNGHVSTDSSMYSPVGSPRESTNARPRSSGNRSSRRGTIANGHNVEAYTKDLPPMGVGFGIRMEESNVEELKQFLDDQTALLVQNIQALVSSIRSDSGITAIVTKINDISSVVGGVIARTETSMSATSNHELRQKGEPILRSLTRCKEQLSAKSTQGRAIANTEQDDDESEKEWRLWNQSLPPIAFEIARETKELVGLVDFLDGAGVGDDGQVDEDFS